MEENTPESGIMIKLVDKVHMSFLMGIRMKGCLMMVLWMVKGVFHLTMETYISESLRKVRDMVWEFSPIKMAISMLVTFLMVICMVKELLLIQMVINELVCGNMESRLNNFI